MSDSCASSPHHILGVACIHPHPSFARNNELIERYVLIGPAYSLAMFLPDQIFLTRRQNQRAKSSSVIHTSSRSASTFASNLVVTGQAVENSRVGKDAVEVMVFPISRSERSSE